MLAFTSLFFSYKILFFPHSRDCEFTLTAVWPGAANAGCKAAVFVPTFDLDPVPYPPSASITPAYGFYVLAYMRPGVGRIPLSKHHIFYYREDSKCSLTWNSNFCCAPWAKC